MFAKCVDDPQVLEHIQNIFVRVPILVDHPHTLQTFGMQTGQR